MHHVQKMEGKKTKITKVRGNLAEMGRNMQYASLA